jgi:hypothetical protein
LPEAGIHTRPLLWESMRLKMGNLSIRFGKAPNPAPDATDPLSRLALSYGVRRDMDEVGRAVRGRLSLPSDPATSSAIRQTIAAVINAGINDAQAVDNLAAGKGLPDWARELADSGGDQSHNSVVELVLDDFNLVLRGGAVDHA